MAQAFQAYLAHDKEDLFLLLDESARIYCELTFRFPLDCIGYPYKSRGLTTLQEWHVPPITPFYSTDAGAAAAGPLLTRWGNSDVTWQHWFWLLKVDGRWLISQIDNVLYED